MARGCQDIVIVGSVGTRALVQLLVDQGCGPICHVSRRTHMVFPEAETVAFRDKGWLAGACDGWSTAEVDRLWLPCASLRGTPPRPSTKHGPGNRGPPIRSQVPLGTQGVHTCVGASATRHRVTGCAPLGVTRVWGHSPRSISGWGCCRGRWRSCCAPPCSWPWSQGQRSPLSSWSRPEGPHETTDH